jgi:UDP-N-acetyl-D-galactosamine dehydrogenase
MSAPLPTGDPTVAVIGLGYVGLPLAVAFGRELKVIGFDIDGERVRQLSRRP